MRLTMRTRNKNRNERIKRIVMEMVVYACVLLASASMLPRLTPGYTPGRTTAQGSSDLIMVQVPVPLEVGMEGKQFTYTVSCDMKGNIVHCGL